MEKGRKPFSKGQEEGEEQLSALIKLAGEEARMRRRKALATHFQKLKEVIAEAVAQQKPSVST